MRIVSDGTPQGTRIYGDNGEDLTDKLYLRAININANTHGVSAELYPIEFVPIDIHVAREHCTLVMPEAPPVPEPAPDTPQDEESED